MTIENSSGAVIQVEARLLALEASLTSALNRITTLEASLDAVQEFSAGDVLRIQQRLSATEAAQTTADANVTTLQNTTIANLASRVTALE